jgi:uncharacterized protein
MYEIRGYRKELTIKGSMSYEVKYETTDLFVISDSNHSVMILEEVKRLRKEILDYAGTDPFFLGSLVPVKEKENAPLIVKRMIAASARVSVGPMASVAGAIAELTGMKVLEKDRQVVIENGGDIFMMLDHDAVFSIFAGSKSPYAGLKIRTGKKNMPLGICTSSGRIGPSLSFGDADAACIISNDAFLADACATKAANLVRNDADIRRALDYTKEIEGILGAVIIRDDKIGLWGDLEILK